MHSTTNSAWHWKILDKEKITIQLIFISKKKIRKKINLNTGQSIKNDLEKNTFYYRAPLLTNNFDAIFCQVTQKSRLEHHCLINIMVWLSKTKMFQLCCCQTRFFNRRKFSFKTRILMTIFCQTDFNKIL